MSACNEDADDPTVRKMNYLQAFQRSLDRIWISCIVYPSDDEEEIPPNRQFCDQMTEAVDKFFGDHIQHPAKEVVTGLHNALRIIATSSHSFTPEDGHLSSLCMKIYAYCVEILFDKAWLNVEVEAKAAATREFYYFYCCLSNWSQDRFLVLAILSQKPWGHEIMNQVLAGEENTDKAEVDRYLTLEGKYLLEHRLRVLIEEGLLHHALNLAKACIDHPALGQEPIFLETLYLLYSNLGMNDELQKQVCDHPEVQDVLEVAKNMLSYCPVPASTLSKLIIERLWSDRHCSNLLITEAIELLLDATMKLCSPDSDTFAELLEHISTLTKEPIHLYNLANLVHKKVGAVATPVVVSICLKALMVPSISVIDDIIQAAKIDYGNAAICMLLSEVLKDDERIQRLCLLAAFFVAPSLESLSDVKESYQSVKESRFPKLTSYQQHDLIECMKYFIPVWVSLSEDWNIVVNMLERYLRNSKVICISLRIPGEDVNRLNFYDKSWHPSQEGFKSVGVAKVKEAFCSVLKYHKDVILLSCKHERQIPPRAKKKHPEKKLPAEQKTSQECPELSETTPVVDDDEASPEWLPCFVLDLQNEVLTEQELIDHTSSDGSVEDSRISPLPHTLHSFLQMQAGGQQSRSCADLVDCDLVEEEKMDLEHDKSPEISDSDEETSTSRESETYTLSQESTPQLRHCEDERHQDPKAKTSSQELAPQVFHCIDEREGIVTQEKQLDKHQVETKTLRMCIERCSLSDESESGNSSNITLVDSSDSDTEMLSLLDELSSGKSDDEDELSFGNEEFDVKQEEEVCRLTQKQEELTTLDADTCKGSLSKNDEDPISLPESENQELLNSDVSNVVPCCEQDEAINLERGNSPDSESVVQSALTDVVKVVLVKDRQAEELLLKSHVKINEVKACGTCMSPAKQLKHQNEKSYVKTSECSVKLTCFMKQRAKKKPRNLELWRFVIKERDKENEDLEGFTDEIDIDFKSPEEDLPHLPVDKVPFLGKCSAQIPDNQNGEEDMDILGEGAYGEPNVGKFTGFCSEINIPWIDEHSEVDGQFLTKLDNGIYMITSSAARENFSVQAVDGVADGELPVLTRETEVNSAPVTLDMAVLSAVRTSFQTYDTSDIPLLLDCYEEETHHDKTHDMHVNSEHERSKDIALTHDSHKLCSDAFRESVNQIPIDIMEKSSVQEEECSTAGDVDTDLNLRDRAFDKPTHEDNINQDNHLDVYSKLQNVALVSPGGKLADVCSDFLSPCVDGQVVLEEYQEEEQFPMTKENEKRLNHETSTLNFDDLSNTIQNSAAEVSTSVPDICVVSRESPINNMEDPGRVGLTSPHQDESPDIVPLDEMTKSAECGIEMSSRLKSELQTYPAVAVVDDMEMESLKLTGETKFTEELVMVEEDEEIEMTSVQDFSQTTESSDELLLLDHSDEGLHKDKAGDKDTQSEHAESEDVIIIKGDVEPPKEALDVRLDQRTECHKDKPVVLQSERGRETEPSASSLTEDIHFNQRETHSKISVSTNNLLCKMDRKNVKDNSHAQAREWQCISGNVESQRDSHSCTCDADITFALMDKPLDNPSCDQVIDTGSTEVHFNKQDNRQGPCQNIRGGSSGHEIASGCDFKIPWIDGEVNLEEQSENRPCDDITELTKLVKDRTSESHMQEKDVQSLHIDQAADVESRALSGKIEVNKQPVTAEEGETSRSISRNDLLVDDSERNENSGTPLLLDCNEKGFHDDEVVNHEHAGSEDFIFGKDVKHSARATGVRINQETIGSSEKNLVLDDKSSNKVVHTLSPQRNCSLSLKIPFKESVSCVQVSCNIDRRSPKENSYDVDDGLQCPSKHTECKVHSRSCMCDGHIQLKPTDKHLDPLSLDKVSYASLPLDKQNHRPQESELANGWSELRIPWIDEKVNLEEQSEVDGKSLTTLDSGMQPSDEKSMPCLGDNCVSSVSRDKSAQRTRQPYREAPELIKQCVNTKADRLNGTGMPDLKKDASSESSSNETTKFINNLTAETLEKEYMLQKQLVNSEELELPTLVQKADISHEPMVTEKQNTYENAQNMRNGVTKLTTIQDSSQGTSNSSIPKCCDCYDAEPMERVITREILSEKTEKADKEPIGSLSYAIHGNADQSTVGHLEESVGSDKETSSEVGLPVCSEAELIHHQQGTPCNINHQLATLDQHACTTDDSIFMDDVQLISDSESCACDREVEKQRCTNCLSVREYTVIKANAADNLQVEECKMVGKYGDAIEKKCQERERELVCTEAAISCIDGKIVPEVQPNSNGQYLMLQEGVTREIRQVLQTSVKQQSMDIDGHKGNFGESSGVKKVEDLLCKESMEHMEDDSVRKEPSGQNSPFQFPIDPVGTMLKNEGAMHEPVSWNTVKNCNEERCNGKMEGDLQRTNKTLRSGSLKSEPVNTSPLFGKREAMYGVTYSRTLFKQTSVQKSCNDQPIKHFISKKSGKGSPESRSRMSLAKTTNKFISKKPLKASPSQLPCDKDQVVNKPLSIRRFASRKLGKELSPHRESNKCPVRAAKHSIVKSCEASPNRLTCERVTRKTFATSKASVQQTVKKKSSEDPFCLRACARNELSRLPLQSKLPVTERRSCSSRLSDKSSSFISKKRSSSEASPPPKFTKLSSTCTSRAQPSTKPMLKHPTTSRKSVRQESQRSCLGAHGVMTRQQFKVERRKKGK